LGGRLIPWSPSRIGVGPSKRNAARVWRARPPVHLLHLRHARLRQPDLLTCGNGLAVPLRGAEVIDGIEFALPAAEPRRRMPTLGLRARLLLVVALGITRRDGAVLSPVRAV
jgi:hypothetical protein